ncbi:MAG: CoB--CoM heterodisulfide reductase iron-sulfur subunit A family protein [Chloroflexota bacterium]|nr:CoB--CoM heterodisulfide reductase iron-sulfur subunit A family protein [Chloroflexota bacterium]
MPSETVLVIGGGPAGLEAARSVAELGMRAILVEKRDRLGGMPDAAHYAALTPDLRDAEEAMAEMAAGVIDHPLADVRLSSTVTACEGSAPDFRVTLSGSNGQSSAVEAGSIIVATGFQHFDPGRETQMYGYYEFPDVITLPECEQMLKAGKFVRPSTGEVPQRVCFIQCVGSRDRRIGNQYCSKVCCGIASKEAIEIRKLSPQTKVFIFYIDMRTYGFWEDQLYWPAQEQHKVNYVRGIVTEILPRNGRLMVKGEDTTMGRPMEVEMDVVILSVGMEPSPGTLEMCRVLGVPREPHGFMATSGGPLDTVSTPVPGIFVAGAAAGPKDLEDSISMAGAAATKAVALIKRGLVSAGARG